MNTPYAYDIIIHNNYMICMCLNYFKSVKIDSSFPAVGLFAPWSTARASSHTTSTAHASSSGASSRGAMRRSDSARATGQAFSAAWQLLRASGIRVPFMVNEKLESRRRRTKGSVVGEEWCQNAAPLR